MMNEAELLHRAIEIAVEGHKNHPTKGEPLYVLHPLRVMMAQTSAIAMIVGVLHDVVEDCEDWSFERLASEGMPDSVLEPLKRVTKAKDADDPDGWSFERLASGEFPEEVVAHFRGKERLTKDEVYDAYIRLAATHPVSRAVKLADLTDNLDESRIGELSEKDHKRLAKYEKAHAWLLDPKS